MYVYINELDIEILVNWLKCIKMRTSNNTQTVT